MDLPSVHGGNDSNEILVILVFLFFVVCSLEFHSVTSDSRASGFLIFAVIYSREISFDLSVVWSALVLSTFGFYSFLTYLVSRSDHYSKAMLSV